MSVVNNYKQLCDEINVSSSGDMTFIITKKKKI